jgi:hypothetical protein
MGLDINLTIQSRCATPICHSLCWAISGTHHHCSASRMNSSWTWSSSQANSNQQSSGRPITAGSTSMSYWCQTLLLPMGTPLIPRCLMVQLPLSKPNNVSTNPNLTPAHGDNGEGYYCACSPQAPHPRIALSRNQWGAGYFHGTKYDEIGLSSLTIPMTSCSIEQRLASPNTTKFELILTAIQTRTSLIQPSQHLPYQWMWSHCK